MTRKRKRRNSIVEIGTGIAVVRIYNINRRDGHSCILCRGGRFLTIDKSLCLALLSVTILLFLSYLIWI